MQRANISGFFHQPKKKKRTQKKTRLWRLRVNRLRNCVAVANIWFAIRYFGCWFSVFYRTTAASSTSGNIGSFFYDFHQYGATNFGLSTMSILGWDWWFLRLGRVGFEGALLFQSRSFGWFRVRPSDKRLHDWMFFNAKIGPVRLAMWMTMPIDFAMPSSHIQMPFIYFIWFWRKV